jgi:hypothetical protein
MHCTPIHIHIHAHAQRTLWVDFRDLCKGNAQAYHKFTGSSDSDKSHKRRHAFHVARFVPEWRTLFDYPDQPTDTTTTKRRDFILEHKHMIGLKSVHRHNAFTSAMTNVLHHAIGPVWRPTTHSRRNALSVAPSDNGSRSPSPIRTSDATAHNASALSTILRPLSPLDGRRRSQDKTVSKTQTQKLPSQICMRRALTTNIPSDKYTTIPKLPSPVRTRSSSSQESTCADSLCAAVHHHPGMSRSSPSAHEQVIITS